MHFVCIHLQKKAGYIQILAIKYVKVNDLGYKRGKLMYFCDFLKT